MFALFVCLSVLLTDRMGPGLGFLAEITLDLVHPVSPLDGKGPFSAQGGVKGFLNILTINTFERGPARPQWPILKGCLGVSKPTDFLTVCQTPHPPLFASMRPPIHASTQQPQSYRKGTEVVELRSHKDHPRCCLSGLMSATENSLR